MHRSFRLTQILVFAFLFAPIAAGQRTAEKEKTKPKSAKVDAKKSKADSAKAKKNGQANKSKDIKKEEAEKADPAMVLEIKMSGSYVDLVQPISFDPVSLLMGGGAGKQKSFYRLCQYIKDVSNNENYDYVVFNLADGNLSLNPAQLDEFARRMKALNTAGKKTFAWLENAAGVHLAIAAQCDEVFIADFGGIDMPSASMESMFYKDAMDLVGVKASVVRAGNFKGAVEPYLNSKMSDHLRNHYLDMLRSMNDARVDAIAKGRGLKPKVIRELQAKRMIMPRQALSAGLVDQLAPYGSMIASIEKEIDDEVEWTSRKKKARQEISFFQLMGQIMAGPSDSSRVSDNSIAVLHLSGTIIDGTKESAGNMVSGPTVEHIEKLINDSKVKGVVVRINSPGGSATASESIRQALVKLVKAKPTIVSMGTVAASGGYWIACIDAPVYAERGTLTGSIGVFSMRLTLGSLLRRVGVHLESITLDDSASAFALNRSWSEQESKVIQESIDMVYSRFLKLASKARGIEIEKLKDLAGGRVWSGDQARRLKLVDSIGGVDDCLAVVAKKAGLDDFKVIHRPITSSGLNLADLLSTGDDDEIWQHMPVTALRALQQRGLNLQTTRTLLDDAMNNRGRPTAWLLNPIEISIR